ncbi:hypothetical protein ACTXPS_19885 [Brachybacterium tyrofermentans]|uniref:hypothetical protein n=1 Tax=Brachybacterium tyrofermentans TaxID=47848 RepID=UPI003FD607DB
MTGIAHTRVRPWTWDEGQPTETIGAMIRTGPRMVFIPAKDLRRVADRLHDRADAIEATE